MESPVVPDPVQRKLDRIGEEFLASIYTIATKRQPENVPALAELGHIYTRLGRYQEGLEVDRRLVAIIPDDPTVRYNLACSQALVGLTDAAFGTLHEAIELGFRDESLMLEDEDLVSLRDDPRFGEILDRLQTLD